jgi:hypothetical protein
MVGSLAEWFGALRRVPRRHNPPSAMTIDRNREAILGIAAQRTARNVRAYSVSSHATTTGPTATSIC